MVGFRAFWWYYFAHVYVWGPVTKSNWLVGLGGQNFFHSQGGHSPLSPSPYATVDNNGQTPEILLLGDSLIYLFEFITKRTEELCGDKVAYDAITDGQFAIQGITRGCFECLSTPKISGKILAHKIVTKFSKLTTGLDSGYRFRPRLHPRPTGEAYSAPPDSQLVERGLAAFSPRTPPHLGPRPFGPRISALLASLCRPQYPPSYCLVAIENAR